MSTQLKYYTFLNNLRRSGVTNMFGASPYLREEFELDANMARKILVEWMEWASQNPHNLDK